MQFGQFLDHDMSLTPEIEFELEECCSGEKSGKADEGCFSIETPCGDDQFAECESDVCAGFIPLTRSVPFCDSARSNSTLVPGRQQFNGNTHFIDGSMVYGSEDELTSQLRSYNNGLLLTGAGNLLPIIRNGQLAGDIRAIENPGLGSLQTLFLREHNRLASSLKVLNKSLSDEELFQRARRINIAEIQNVVYGQYIRELVGPELHEKYNLTTAQDSSYNIKYNPSISNAFATAAYRFVLDTFSILKMYKNN
jgi:peroxidase